MKKKILSILLSFTLIFSTTGFAFADTDLDNPPAKPDKPKVETYKDNDKAKEYNKEAKEYNKDVDKYNAAVDKEYNQAVKDINQKNAEGQAKQEASQKAHDDAVAANEAEQARVDSENAKIDEQNAAGAASASSHNASEDAKVKQNKKDREAAEVENASRKAQYDADVEAAEKEYEEAVAAEKERIEAIKAENELIRQHNAEEDQKVADTEVANKTEKERIDAENAKRESKYLEDVAQYEADKAKYDEDYANYSSAANQTDIKNEQIILNAGMSIEEYNMLPLKSGPIYDPETGTYTDDSEQFENLLKKAVYRNDVRRENNALKEKEYTSTVNVQESEEKSGETYTLYLTHYLSNGQSYEETITFDANDTITVKSLAYANNSKPLYEDENYGAFYNYQGNNYLSRYWYQTFGQFEYPPFKDEADYQEIHDKGNSYTFSYKNGKKYASDSNEIYVTYYYNSQVTANIPLPEPTAPTEPTLELLGFEPIIYNPNYLEELDETENIIEKRVVEEPEYVEVPEIYNPSYETYTPIEHISPIFIDVPDVETWVNLPDPVKREYLKHVSLLGLLPVPTKTNTPSAPAPKTSETTIIFTDNIPTENNPTTDIKNTNTPLMNKAFAPTGEWALINLIAMLLTFLIAIILIISLAINKIREANDDKEYNNKAIKRILTIIASIISGIVFLLTEDITLPMVLVDKWTIVMIVILLINIIIAILSRRKEKKNEEE